MDTDFCKVLELLTQRHRTIGALPDPGAISPLRIFYPC
jgi:hypothetical protein